MRLRGTLLLVLVLLATGCASPGKAPSPPPDATPASSPATPSPTPSTTANASGDSLATQPPGPPTLASPKPPPPSSTPPSGSPGCSNAPAAAFTKPFTNASLLDHISPLGGIGTGGLGRTYVFTKRDGNGTFTTVPVYAPGDATLFGFAYYNTSYNGHARAEYRLEFAVNCTVSFQFAHVAAVVDAITAVTPPPTSSSQDSWYGHMDFHAGDLIGTTEGTLQAGSWDFVVLDKAHEVPHANLSRWTAEQNRFAACPYDAFVEPLRTGYHALFATAGGTRVPNAPCRSASLDVPGSLAGSWFQGDATDNHGPRLDIATDLDGSVAIGLRRGDEPIARFSDEHPATAPETVQLAGEACYTNGQDHRAFRLVSATQIQFETSSGACPAAFPTANVETWSR